MKEEHILSPDDGFLVNLYVILFVNVLGIILALQINPLVIYGAYRNKQLNKITRILTILLAIAGLFGALVIQCSFVASKISVLANIQNPEQSDYCNFILVVTYGTKVVGGLSLITMSGITAERLAAVVYPFHYRTTRTLFVKTLPYALVAFFIHFILSGIWSWYENFAKIVTAIFIIIPYVFTIYAYGKIYFKLRKSSGTHTAAKKQSITSVLVVVTYLISFLPLAIIRGSNLDKNNLVVQFYIRPWCNTLLFFSFSLNAVVYGWGSVMQIIS